MALSCDNVEAARGNLTASSVVRRDEVELLPEGLNLHFSAGFVAAEAW
jgi:hypothetical protein